MRGLVERVRDLYGDAVADIVQNILDTVNTASNRIRDLRNLSARKSQKIKELQDEIKRLNDMIKERDAVIEKLLKG